MDDYLITICEQRAIAHAKIGTVSDEMSQVLWDEFLRILDAKSCLVGAE